MNSFCREKFMLRTSYWESNVTVSGTQLTQPTQPTQQTIYSKAYNKDATRIPPLLLASILIVIVAIIFKFVFHYEPIFELFFPPFDWPIFRDLTNTTGLISGQLAELNIPASSVIINYRVTSQYLADVIDRNDLSPNNSDEIAQYLNQLGDKIGNSGKTIEKMYPVGNMVLREIVMELKFIIDNIRSGQILSQQNVTYLADRYGKILSTVTKLRDKFQKITDELDDLYILYNGTHHQLANGIDDVELFFEEITPELGEYYDMEQLKRDLGYLKQIMEKVPDIRRQIHRLLSEFNNHRQILIRCHGEWSSLRRRKLVSSEDTESLEEVITKLNRMAETFMEKDQENYEIRIYV
ncbi:7381_t:CDS:2 [Cetraspora pellucida]|uniref:7381_t:CDS:1 n=1 Tax=Cetraspora pellucida TaxID=1433469 RepID=A0A9N8ZUB6_9GLOM|nr:7381_t:CDS:2 [Cetraspora pellucida]